MSSRTARLWLATALACQSASALAAAGLVVVNPQAQYPEGPVEVGSAVFYAEMGADRILRWDGAANSEVWSSRGCMPTSVARGQGDSLIVLCHRGAVVRITPAGEQLAIVEARSVGGLFDNPNASVNDDRGGVYFSSSGAFGPGAPATGAILYLSGEGTLRQVAAGIHYANGVAVSRDGKTLFASEHLERRVLSFDVAADGALSNARVFLRLDDVVDAHPGRSWEVGPDGLAVDERGNLYIAEYGGGRLIIVDAAGQLVTTIAFPEPYVTAPTLIEGGRRIFVTAPVSLMDPTASGKVYVVDNPVWRGD